MSRKGTGYFYSRYRPGVGAVLGLLFFVISGFHWLGMAIGARSHRARINDLIKDAHDAAGYPGLSKRKRVTAETGRVFIVETTGDVYLVQGPNEFLLSPSEVPSASFDRTLVVRVPLLIFRKTVGRLLTSDDESSELDDDSSNIEKETIKTIDTDQKGDVKVEKVFSGKKSGVRRRN